MHFKIQCLLNLRSKMRCGIDVNRAHSFITRLVVPLEMMVALTTSNPVTFVDSFPSLGATQALAEWGSNLGHLKVAKQWNCEMTVIWLQAENTVLHLHQVLCTSDNPPDYALSAPVWPRSKHYCCAKAAQSMALSTPAKCCTKWGCEYFLSPYIHFSAHFCL